jgi:hypothetical protein
MLRKKILRSSMMMMMMLLRLFSLCLPRDSLTTKLLLLSHSSRFPTAPSRETGIINTRLLSGHP